MYMRDCVHEYKRSEVRMKQDRHEGVTECTDRARRKDNKNFGGDALRGNTRSHPEHDG